LFSVKQALGYWGCYFMRKYQTVGVLILALLLVSLFAYTLVLNNSTQRISELHFSAFVNKVQQGEIARVVIVGNDAEAIPRDVATARLTPAQQPLRVLKTPAASNTTAKINPVAGGLIPSPSAVVQPIPKLIPLKYHIALPAEGGLAYLLPKLEQGKVDVRFEQPEQAGRWWTILGSLFLPIMLLLMVVLVYRNAQSGGSQAMSFGKSRAKLMVDSKVSITFKDVAGIDEAKAELEEVVDFLKNAERYLKLGAKIPRGVLLVGSPGTGKTLLAKAVAGEAGVPFFSISGSDFVEMFVGVGASRVRDLFEQAKKQAPCIVFVDEIDAVGRQRGAGMGGGHDEREQTLNQLLVEMDGFDGTTGIIVVAATNRPDILDNALLRPGRFDRQVIIDKPDLAGREQILLVHAKGKPLTPEVDMKRLAKRTSGFSGADLANLLNESALLAARRQKEVIEPKDVEDSIDRVVVGLEKKSKVISEADKEITAYHEIGHALTSLLIPNMDPLRKVTIVPRGMALGYSWNSPDEEMERTHVSKTRLLGEISVALGGRVAEELVFSEVCTGASNDLEKVTKTARSLVTRFGMSNTLGSIVYGQQNEHVFMGRDYGTTRDYSEEVAAEIDREIKRIVDERYAFTRNLLTENRDMMDALAKALLEKETLDDREVDDIIKMIEARRRGETYTPTPPPEPPAPPAVESKTAVASASTEKNNANEGGWGSALPPLGPQPA
jgi:cell division protease FtsH